MCERVCVCVRVCVYVSVCVSACACVCVHAHCDVSLSTYICIVHFTKMITGGGKCIRMEFKGGGGQAGA